MTKKSIGQFMSALRKANGMTQQDVAERLNVSNKTVSRWERDECAPDISVIPALAELFGVSCDELIKGERIIDNRHTEKCEPKVDKQIKSLINRTISKFKTLIWISIALSAVGLICMFGIYYGFQKPAIGFAVMLLFETAAFIMTAIAVDKMKAVKSDNKLFESADTHLTEKYNKSFGTYSFISFYAVFSTVLLSLPLVFNRGIIVGSTACSLHFAPVIIIIRLVPVLIFAFLKLRTPYASWITRQQPIKEKNSKVRLLNLLQLGILLPATILFTIAVFCGVDSKPAVSSYSILSTVGCALLAASLVCFIILMVKCKADRKALLLPGIRNFLIAPSVLLFSGMYAMPTGYVGITGTAPATTQIIYDYHWSWLFFFDGFAFVCTIAVIFEIIKALLNKKTKKAAGK